MSDRLDGRRVIVTGASGTFGRLLDVVMMQRTL